MYEHIKTANYESYKRVIDNTAVADRWYEDAPLNKSDNIKVIVLQAFVIAKDKNFEQSSTISGGWLTDLFIDSSNFSAITKAARARWQIENQCFNALKNSGCELTHNLAHVKEESFGF